MRFIVRHGAPAPAKAGNILFSTTPFRSLFVLFIPVLFAAPLIIAPAAARAANEHIAAIVPQFPVQADYEPDYRMLEQLGLERFAIPGGGQP